jgi:O-antigen/teichoic acid export membrane protein
MAMTGTTSNEDPPEAVGRRRKLLTIARGSMLATRDNTVFFLAFSVANVCSFLFHVIVSRRLPPADYGALGALLGLSVLLLIPIGALQTAITQTIAPRLAAGETRTDIDVRPLLANGVLWALGVFLVFVAATPLLQGFLHLPNTRSAILLATGLIPFVIGVVPKAILLAHLRFVAMAAALVSGALVRLVLAYWFVSRGYGIEGAVAATVLAEVTTTSVALLMLREEFAHRPTASPVKVAAGDSLRAVGAFTGFWALTVVDVLLARHTLARTASGFYTAASTASSSVLFVAGGVSAAVFPRFAAEQPRSVNGRRTLVHALSLVGAIGVLGALGLTLLASPVVRLLFGPNYLPAVSVLGILAMTAALVAVVQLLVHFHIAARSGAALAPWCAVAAAAVAISVQGTSLHRVAVLMLAVSATLTVVMLAVAFRPRPPDRPAPGPASRELWELPAPDHDLTLVVPYFNPGPRFRPNLVRLLEVLDNAQMEAEVIAVDDGCTDGSPATIADLASDRLRLVQLDRNAGKGEALRIGLGRGRGRYLGFIDADGDIEADQVTAFIALMKLYEPDVILGSKRHPMSDVDYPPIRRLYSWGYQRLCRVLFRLDVQDTQTGLKFIRREVLAAVLPRMVEKRFAFDLELMVVARHLGYQKYFEAPVKFSERFGSTVRVRSVWHMLVDTLAIFYRLRILGYYDGA